MCKYVCVYVFMCVNVCVYVCIYACKYVCMYYVCKYVCGCIYVCKYVFMSLAHWHRGCPRGVMVKAMDCGIVEREFVLQSRYYVHFRANTLGKYPWERY